MRVGGDSREIGVRARETGKERMAAGWPCSRPLAVADERRSRRSSRRRRSAAGSRRRCTGRWSSHPPPPHLAQRIRFSVYPLSPSTPAPTIRPNSAPPSASTHLHFPTPCSYLLHPPPFPSTLSVPRSVLPFHRAGSCYATPCRILLLPVPTSHLPTPPPGARRARAGERGRRGLPKRRRQEKVRVPPSSTPAKHIPRPRRRFWRFMTHAVLSQWRA